MDVQFTQPHHVALFGGNECIAEISAGRELLENQGENTLGAPIAHGVVAEAVASRCQQVAERFHPVAPWVERQPELRGHGPGVGHVQPAVAPYGRRGAAGQALRRLLCTHGVIETGGQRRLDDAGLETDGREGSVGRHVRVDDSQLQRCARIRRETHRSTALQPLVAQCLCRPWVGKSVTWGAVDRVDTENGGDIGGSVTEEVVAHRQATGVSRAGHERVQIRQDDVRCLHHAGDGKVLQVQPASAERRGVHVYVGRVRQVVAFGSGNRQRCPGPHPEIRGVVALVAHDGLVRHRVEGDDVLSADDDYGLEVGVTQPGRLPGGGRSDDVGVANGPGQLVAGGHAAGIAVGRLERSAIDRDHGAADSRGVAL